MGALQPLHLVVILVIVLIVFGPGKLTDIGGQLGKGIREFREVNEDAKGTTSAVRCTECGAALAESPAFCAACGTKVVALS